jgi:ATP-dependent Clp protease ATP-binding subunit ClpC
MANLDFTDPAVSAARYQSSFQRFPLRVLFGLLNITTVVSILILFSYPLWQEQMVGVAAIVAGIGIFFFLFRHGISAIVSGSPDFDQDALMLLAESNWDSGRLRERLVSNPRIQYFLIKVGQTPAPSSDIFEAVFEKAKNFAAREQRKAGPIDLLRAATNLSGDDVRDVAAWDAEQQEREQHLKNRFDPEHLALTGGFAKDWASGYTIILDRYSHDLTAHARKNAIHLVGRGDALESLEEILSKGSHSHAVLVGDPGVGKETVVLALAKKIAEGRSSPALAMRHLKIVDLSSLVAGMGPEDFEVRLIQLLNEAARAGNITLFFPNIESILGGTGGKGSERESGVVDASAVLARFLDAGVLQLVATTNWEGYHQTIEKNPALSGKFTKIEVEEPKESEMPHILLDSAVPLENRYRLIITYPAIVEVSRLAGRYLKDAPFPEKAINLLEEVCVAVSSAGGHRVSPEDVEGVVSRRTKIPVGPAVTKEKEVLLHLEDKLHERIVDQNEAISAVSDSLRRARAGLKRANRPIGAFLFLGPTGVGKTETAKTVAWAYFGNEHAMIRADFQEYATEDKLTQLQTFLTTKVRENPYTLILIDEVEKGAKAAQNLLLSLIDEGTLDDESGKPVDFTNAIIIATSNAGAELIRESVQANMAYDILKTKLLDSLQKSAVFSAEFLNRFDGVIVYKPLGETEVVAVVSKIIADLNRTLADQKVKVSVEPAAEKLLAKEGYNPVFGARALRRVVQEKVENVVARKILSGELKEGDTLALGTEDLS